MIFGASQAFVVFLGKTNISISPNLLSMIPYLLTIIILVSFVGKSVAPAADGVAYEK